MPNTHSNEILAELPVLLKRSLEGLCLFDRLSVCHCHPSLLQHVEKHMSKGNKGNWPERKLEAQEKRAALDISFQTASQSVK
jgi:hypothetical protein